MKATVFALLFSAAIASPLIQRQSDLVVRVISPTGASKDTNVRTDGVNVPVDLPGGGVSGVEVVSVASFSSFSCDITCQNEDGFGIGRDNVSCGDPITVTGDAGFLDVSTFGLVVDAACTVT